MTSFADHFDAQNQWRRGVRDRVGEFLRFVELHGLADDESLKALSSLAGRLASDKLVVAFVAEFSRGKSELINAMFFGDAGRRVLPATPGRTTMCPVELGYTSGEGASLMLLPIETRLEGLSLADLRQQPERWKQVPIDLARRDSLPEALAEVTSTKAVRRNDARQLGFWDDDRPGHNPPVDASGRVQVPAWRHALINYPHPLLRQGLVVIDTPGLNAIGAEPELTLGLLPSAHAAVFVLGADTGVTQSDMTIWREHLGELGAAGPSRFVVLNKIDTLADPLLSAAEVQAQIASQCRLSAESLGVPVAQVFAVSARQALAARLKPDAPALAECGISALEQALAAELLPQRRLALRGQVLDTAAQLEARVARHLADGRRELADQLAELRSLRGKSGARLQMMLARIDADAADFERCTPPLQALRTVHTRMLREALAPLASDRLRTEVSQMQKDMESSLLNLGARRAFAGLCSRLRSLLTAAARQDEELRTMLGTQYAKLNADFGLSLVVADAANLAPFIDELNLIETNYVRYLGLTQALRLAQAKFREQFRRMLVSKLRVVFESASGELELWHKATSTQLDLQLRDRRKSFRKRRDALQRVQGATGELEARIADIERQDRRFVELAARVAKLAEAARREASDTDPGLPLAALAA